MGLAYDLVAFDVSSSNFAPKPRFAKFIGNSEGELALEEEPEFLIVRAPKPNGKARPGAHVAVPTRLRVATELEECLPHIRQVEERSLGLQYANRLRSGLKKVRQKGIHSRNGWQLLHSALIDTRCGFVGVADVERCYERITGNVLERVLKRLPLPTRSIDVFCEYAETSGYGLPQGCSVSDTLAMLVLQPLLEKASTYVELRAYSDDVRVVGRSKLAVSERLSVVSRIFTDHGFSFGPAKYRVYDGMGADLALRGFVSDDVEVEKYFGKDMAFDFDESVLTPAPYGNGSKSVSTFLPPGIERYVQDRFVYRCTSGSAHLDKLAIRHGASTLLGVMDAIRDHDPWLLPEAITALPTEQRVQWVHSVVQSSEVDEYTKSQVLLRAKAKSDVSVGNACIQIMRDHQASGYLTTAAAIAAPSRKNLQLGVDTLVAFGRTKDLGTAVEIIGCASEHLHEELKVHALRTFSDRSAICKAAAVKFLAS